MDLVDAVEYAKEEGSKNPYWTWDQARRDEFKSYRAALRAQEEQQREEEGDDDHGIDDILAECSPSPHDTAAQPEEEEEEEEQQQQPEPAPKKAPSKWIEYCGYAREALKEGGGKPTQKQVFAKAREWLIEDRWMKPK